MVNAGTVAPGMPQPAAGPSPEQQRIAQEQEAARTSHLFATTNAGQTATVAIPAAGAIPGVVPAAAGSPGLTSQDHKFAFLNGDVDRRTVSPDRVEAPASTNILQAGAVIAASLLTGLRSDLPGQVTAQVTENVYDSPTGRILLIPQGARLVGQYDAQVAFGQSRALLVWNRLIMPNGRSIVLERQPGADPEGYAGLEDQVDNHWGMLFKAAILSTLLSVGSEAGTSDNENSLVQAIRQGASQSFSQVGEQVVGRSLNVQPTITIRPGFPVRVLVTHDLVLEPYQS
jgi:type IV secretion system protein VirB10